MPSCMVGLPKHLIDKLQHLRNSAAGLVTLTRRQEHITNTKELTLAASSL